MAPKLITLLCLGAQDELSLSAWPSPLVPLGGRVTLSCHSRLQFVMFTIFQTSGSQIRESYTGLSNHVTINAVTPGHAGTYKCAGIYKHTSKQSAGSKSLNIIVTGLFTKPSISAHPSSLVHAGARVRLCCHSELAFDEFILYKEGNTQHSQQYGKMIQAGHHFSKAVFSMGPITPAHAGAYRCCGSFNHSRYMWSAPSDPLDIVITGKYKKPSLITRENAVVGPGDIVTLFCSSRIPFDKYHLSRKQEAHGHWLSGGQSHNGIFQVDLPLCFVSPTSVGSYRCYDAFNESPYEWSAPSDPLHIPVTGISESACPTPMESSPETGSHPQDYTAGNLIRMGVAVLVLVVIGVLLLESCIVRKKKPKRKKKKNTKENHSPFRTIEAWNPIS
ncbi:putative killer cell immunoglobulin-like receptor-like protein KIR3DX1 isoform X2 [Piliocolobus tephrosceles]|uniref:putative killer cell immunoglobulin-like receptor-like protein KIR3DX1 isoform X2 n=1 Tax=Piliocolobus tephrosceles TaxID=591936 RepID=UPI000E6AEB20|nr:putative killer cell immunoglobulin-like receptor-like protein KIR3DX1 isoform X2 [Piliocolobus tephrosceles]XP_026308304.1 putative killer cell immunoglobulin-like receptor-like protein KIR3DX1 isoform X2 [Piliocolobus tephrosceles]